MAERIGKGPPAIVRNIEFSVDVPTLLNLMATGEEHVKHVQAIQIFSALLDAVAKKAIDINNPELTELMFKMKLLKVMNNEGDNFSDI